MASLWVQISLSGSQFFALQEDAGTGLPASNFATNFTMECTSATAGTATFFIKMDTVAPVSWLRNLLAISPTPPPPGSEIPPVPLDASPSFSISLQANLFIRFVDSGHGGGVHSFQDPGWLPDESLRVTRVDVVDEGTLQIFGNVATSHVAPEREELRWPGRAQCVIRSRDSVSQPERVLLADSFNKYFLFSACCVRESFRVAYRSVFIFCCCCKDQRTGNNLFDSRSEKYCVGKRKTRTNGFEFSLE